jgi:hypothetical protein
MARKDPPDGRNRLGGREKQLQASGDDCLERLHKSGVKTYWTEVGNGAEPELGLDIVSGNIVVEVAPGASTYTVRHNDSIEDSYPVRGGAAPGGQPESVATSSAPKFAWN